MGLTLRKAGRVATLIRERGSLADAAVVLGTATLRNGHWVMFILGIPLPILWAIGALIEPTPRAREAL